jgi:cysteine desulfuration protein SufE
MQYEKMKNLLNSLENPVDKLEMVMDFGRELESVPQNSQCHEITGCASHVEICVGSDGHLYGIADSGIVRGVLAILLAMVDSKTPTQIREMDLMGEFSGLNLNLGAARLSGLNSMISFLKNL